MIINNTPDVICRGADTNTHILTHKYLVHYSGISSHSFGCLYAAVVPKTPAATAMAVAKKNNNQPKNGNDDSNNNDNENKGNGIVDGSAALAVAAGRRQQKRGGGGQRDQYIPNWNCLLFN